MNFEEYLISKKIDSAAFQAHEPTVWESWKEEFAQLHPNSFTAQKLYLINPIRRKYQLKFVPPIPEKKEQPATPIKEEQIASDSTPAKTETPAVAKPAMAKPVFKPKPKMN